MHSHYIMLIIGFIIIWNSVKFKDTECAFCGVVIATIGCYPTIENIYILLICAITASLWTWFMIKRPAEVLQFRKLMDIKLKELGWRNRSFGYQDNEELSEPEKKDGDEVEKKDGDEVETSIIPDSPDVINLKEELSVIKDVLNIKKGIIEDLEKTFEKQKQKFKEEMEVMEELKEDQLVNLKNTNGELKENIDKICIEHNELLSKLQTEIEELKKNQKKPRKKSKPE